MYWFIAIKHIIYNIEQKGELMSDLIDRQAAIDALDECFKKVVRARNMSAYEYDSAYAQGEIDAYVAAIDAVKALLAVPPERVCVATVTLTDEQLKEVAEKAKNAVISVIESEPHWIPCSERLPKEKQSVLVTDGSVVWVCDIISTDEGYKWEDSHGYWLDLDEWTAWMSLPKPTGGDME